MHKVPERKEGREGGREGGKKPEIYFLHSEALKLKNEVPAGSGDSCSVLPHGRRE
jgi:hypothetical protein